MTDSLEKSLGYVFNNKTLLENALTHPSKSYDLKEALVDNQRLEFLGDAVLQLILTEMIYSDFPDYPEGQMTMLRSRIVSKEGLLQIATSIELAQYMKMSKGEHSQGGENRASTLADAVEAILGAIFLDGGLESAKACMNRLLGTMLTDAALNTSKANPKGKLQEILQELLPISPVYQVLSEEGLPHDKVYIVQIIWGEKTLSSGTGKSKKLAEIAAATKAIETESWK